MVHGLIELVSAVVVLVALLILVRASRAAFSGAFHPSIHQRVERLLAPYEGRPLAPELLEELRAQLETLVRDTLVDLHHAGDVVVILQNDDVLGPVCRLQLAGGPELSPAEFEAKCLK